MQPIVEANRDLALLASLREVYARMSARLRRQFYLVLLLMFAGGIAELSTVGAVIPFLALLAHSNHGSGHWRIFMIATRLGGDPLVAAAVLFILFAVLAGFIRLLLARARRRFVYGVGHELGVEIQRRVLLQPYSFHIHRHTSSLLTALYKTDAAVIGVFLPLLHAVTAGSIALIILAFLLFIDPLTTLFVAAALAFGYALVVVLAHKKLAANSRVLETAYDERLQLVQESLGGIREVIVDNAQAMYLTEFASLDAELGEARSTTEFISLVPRYLIEMVAIAAIAAIALAAAARGDFGAALPVLGALALGAQRMLPLVQEVYSGWSTLAGQRSILAQVIELLCLPISQAPEGFVAPLVLERRIALEGVSFTYPTRKRPAVEDVSFAISAGTMMALVGPTGSGKSSLLDLLMGLLQPDSGRILIDETELHSVTQRRWRRSVAHVPQSIFLADTTIAGNIALSLPDEPPDRDRIMEAAKKAQLHDFVVSLPDGYETQVGERGVRLSGGQRQRLGIARAIYKGAPILVLDEATSALDQGTEREVIAALEELREQGRTIIIVSHRLSTVRHCDMIARLDRGRLVGFGDASELLGSDERVS